LGLEVSATGRKYVLGVSNEGKEKITAPVERTDTGAEDDRGAQKTIPGGFYKKRRPASRSWPHTDNSDPLSKKQKKKKYRELEREEKRRRSHGRAAMEALKRECRKRGGGKIGKTVVLTAPFWSDHRAPVVQKREEE